jgi:hypothetical protein
MRGRQGTMRRGLIALALLTVAVIAPASFAPSVSAKQRAVAAPRCARDWTDPEPQIDSPAYRNSGSAPWVVALPGGRHDVEFCGPAQVVVRFLDGASFQIRGGQCVLGSGMFLVRIGTLRHEQGAPAEYVGLYIHDTRAGQSGTFRLAEAATKLIYATVEHGGSQLAIRGGAITIARSKRSGTFTFRLRDATRISGAWNCD